jgi:hypothetical protein
MLFHRRHAGQILVVTLGAVFCIGSAGAEPNKSSPPPAPQKAPPPAPVRGAAAAPRGVLGGAVAYGPNASGLAHPPPLPVAPRPPVHYALPPPAMRGILQPPGHPGLVRAPGLGPHPIARPVVLHTARPMNLLSQRMSACSNASAPGCAVWGRMGDQGPVVARIAASAQMQGSAHRAWVGVDGVQREVWINYTPAVATENIVFVPAGAAVVGAGYAGYASGGGPIDGSSPPDSYSGSNLATNGTAASVSPSPAPNSSVGPIGGAAGSPVQTPADSNASVAVVPQAICRHMQETASVGGVKDQADELECRDANGDWSPAIRQADLTTAKGAVAPSGV